MDSIVEFQRSVLRQYGIVVTTTGNVPRHVSRPIQEDETWAAWQLRVMGFKDPEMRVFRPNATSGRTLLKTLSADSKSFKRVLLADLEKTRDKSRQAFRYELLVERERVEVDAVSDALAARRDALEPATVEYLERMIEGATTPYIDDLINAWITLKDDDVRNQRCVDEANRA
jgi:hypothetical protein